MKWTKDKIKFLKDNSNKYSYKEIAERLNINYDSVRTKAYSLGLRKYENVNWTEKQDNYIKNNYEEKGGAEIARILNVSPHAVYKRAEKFNLNVNPKYKSITSQGYIELKTKKYGRILEHRYIMSEYLGRELKSDEIVHHINGDKQDNKLENLKLMSREEHVSLHRDDLNN